MIYIYTLKHISREAVEKIRSGFHHFTQEQEGIATVVHYCANTMSRIYLCLTASAEPSC